MQAVELWHRALDLHRRGQFGEAEKLYRRLIAAQWGVGRVHYHLALIERETGRGADARASLECALAADPLDPDAHNELGRVLEGQGAFSEAAASYKRAISLRVSHAGAQENLSRLQATRGCTDADNPVSIITATQGRPELTRNIKSVSAQRYGSIQHLIIIDGPEAEAAVRRIVEAASPTVPTHLMTLPWNTGRNGYHGHRAYAAGIHLVNGRFVALLDDDNWMDEDHIFSLVACAVAGQHEWVYSLRKICGRDGRFYVNDNCRSLGALSPVQWEAGLPEVHHIDMNCFFLRRDVAVAYAALFHNIARKTLENVDTMLCRTLLAERRRFATTAKYTLNYSLSERPDAPSAKAFIDGDAAMHRRYPDGLPWQAEAPAAGYGPQAAGER